MAQPGLTPGMAAEKLERVWGARVTQAWARETLREVARRRPGMDAISTMREVANQWLDVDVRVAGVTAGPVLPPNMAESRVVRLPGIYVLMLVEGVERVGGTQHSLLLTDGCQEVKALEAMEGPTPELLDSIPFGTKLQLQGPVTARSGLLFLEPGQVEVWGGEVTQQHPPQQQQQHLLHDGGYQQVDYGYQQYYQGNPQPLQQPFAHPQPLQQIKVVFATCSLVSTTRFALVMADHTKLPGTIRGLPTARLEDNHWTFALEDHTELQVRAIPLFREIRVTPLPVYVLDTFLRPSTAEPSTDLRPVEAHLLDQLMPFQREGVLYGVSRGGRVLIADDMGLGKTVQALALASYYRGSRPVLVVAPSSVTFAWRDEVRRWLPAVHPQDIAVIATGKDAVGQSQFVIISYGLVAAKKDELTKRKFQFVILDESHMVKDAATARYRAVEPLARGAAHLVLLSGTPALSRPIELYTQVRLIDPKFYTSKKEFGERYCDFKIVTIGRNQQVPDYSGASNTTELALLLKAHCMVRRFKPDVLTHLPTKQRQKVEIAVGRQHLDREMEQRRAEAEQEGRQEVKLRPKLLQWFAATAPLKLPAVLEHLRGLLAEGRKFLVFFHHQAMGAGVTDMLDQQRVAHIKIDGKVSSEERARRVDRFQEDDRVRVAVLSITAANSGITLTAATLVVFAELFWNPGNLLQAEDRAHRIGQTGSVTVQYLVAKGTADDELWPMVAGKLEVLGQVGLTREDFGAMEVGDGFEEFFEMENGVEE